MREFPFNVRAAARVHTDMILSLPNVVGVGVGQRRVGGVVTDEPSVLTYVSRKLPREALRREERVPGHLDADGDKVRTDVVEVAEPRYVAVDTAMYRPLRGGCQIGAAGKAGTAGALMYDRRDQELVLLTNNHVLTSTSDPVTLPANSSVQQPAGGLRIGQSKRIVPMFRAPLGVSDYRFFAPVDAGIVAVDATVAVDFEVLEVGRQPFVVLPPFVGLDVVRRGFRTQLRSGTVEAVDLTMIATASNGDRHRIGGPGGVFSIRSPERLISAMPGDSGSLVMDADGGAARGLVFASDSMSGGITWACELGTIMTLLELDTPGTGSAHALIRRSILRRVAAKVVVSDGLAAAAGAGIPLVAEMITTFGRFRERHLQATDAGLGAAIGVALHRLAPDLASAITNDEDVAGLLDRTIGEWLIQPTVFDMLEYRFADDVGMHASAALRRLREVSPTAKDLDLFGRLSCVAAGRSVRELLGLAAGEVVDEEAHVEQTGLT